MNPSLSKKLVMITTAAITVIICIVIFLSYTKSRSVLTDNLVKEMLPGRLHAITADLEKELETYRSISVGMNGDLREMDVIIKGSKEAPDDARIVSYLSHIKNTHSTTAAFFASALNNRYYVYDKFLKTVSPNVEKDRWFFDSRKSGKP